MDRKVVRRKRARRLLPEQGAKAPGIRFGAQMRDFLHRNMNWFLVAGNVDGGRRTRLRSVVNACSETPRSAKKICVLARAIFAASGCMSQPYAVNPFSIPSRREVPLPQ